jgi:hypothetical protein
MPLNIQRARNLLQDFEFGRLFIEELGWSPPGNRRPTTAQLAEMTYTSSPIAELSGIGVFCITTQDGSVPDAKTRAAIQKRIAERCYENLLVFTDSERTQSLWYWVKREAGKSHPRDHLYVKGQPGDLFLGKLASMVVEISDLDDSGNISVIEVASRLKRALDVEKTTKRFFREFDEQHLDFLRYLEDISDDRSRQWYASVLLNRLMFIWFLQKKGFLNGGDRDYLVTKLNESKNRGKDRFFADFLRCLFFEGFAKPEAARSDAANRLVGKIRYLNGGLFLPHKVEQEHGYTAGLDSKPKLRILDEAFEKVFGLFSRYSWYLDDRPGQDDNEINPDVLGYIFEKYINQKEFGAYYTRPEITGYLCEQTIHRLVLDRVNSLADAKAVQFQAIGDLLLRLDAPLCRRLLHDILPDLKILDPACGSGAFLVAAMQTLINIYSAVLGKIQVLNDSALSKWFRETQQDHSSIGYYIKKRVITDNLFGVDIMEEATEIARLRLFLALVASAETEQQLEPLPNIDFNILSGNSLIGLLRVEASQFDATGSMPLRPTGEARKGQGRLVLKHTTELGLAFESASAPTRNETMAAFLAESHARRFQEILDDKNKAIELYKKHAFLPGTRDGLDQEERMLRLREHIEKVRAESYRRINEMLLQEFQGLGIQFEQATWDDRRSGEGKPLRRPLQPADIEALKPFHWGYEFDQILHQRGGFDAIITNPPWEVLEPSAKEFFEKYSSVVTKNKMTIQEFEKERARLLRQEDIRTAWLDYLSLYPHLARFFKLSPRFSNQTSRIKEKIAGSKTNLYKLFIELCFHLLRPGGQCGLVVPDGICNGRGTTQLRRLIFEQTSLKGLFCLENRKQVFEGVDSRFKFVIFTFQKGGKTHNFPAAYMRTDVRELARFPTEGAINIDVKLVRDLSPDLLSLTEFKNAEEIAIARKFLKFPRLDEEFPEKWNVVLAQELNMTADSSLFHKERSAERLPLVQGGMFHQFEAALAEPKFWIKEAEGRLAVLGREKDIGQRLPYQTYRLAHRRIARSTDERSVIACVLPPGRFCADTAQTTREAIEPGPLLFLTAVLNSFVVDWELRLRITTHVDMHFVYAIRVPRLTSADPAFAPLMKRGAQLTCVTPEFRALAKEAGLGSHHQSATESGERARLRAEIDGLAAHLYGLTESEFAHILSTFPLVSESVKLMARNAFRDAQNGLIK